MSQDWRDLFGTIDVSANGIRGNGARTVAAPQPQPQSIQPKPVAAATVAEPAVSPAQASSTATPAAASYPGVWTMAQTFTSSAVQFAASGGKTVSRDVREQRLSICQTCPQYDGTRCIQCGCFIAAKTWVPHEKCPAGKWPS